MVNGNGIPLATVKRVAYKPMSVTKGSQPDSIVVHGTELLAQAITTTGVLGEILLNLPIAPSTFIGTRMSEFAKLYERFLFKRIRMHFVPSCSAVATGSLSMGYDRDVADLPPSANWDGIKSFTSYAGTVTSPLYAPTTCEFKLMAHTDPLWTGVSSDVRFSYQGRLLGMLSGVTNVAAGTAFGMFYFEYECELFIPQHREAIFNSAYTAGAYQPASGDMVSNTSTGTAVTNSGTSVWEWVPVLGKWAMKLLPGTVNVTRGCTNSGGAGGSSSMATNSPVFTSLSGQVLTVATQALWDNFATTAGLRQIGAALYSIVEPVWMYINYIAGANIPSNPTFMVADVADDL